MSKKTAARRTTMAEETPSFRSFWDAWIRVMHKNDGRGAARDEFFRHVELYGVDPQDIVDGAKQYIREGGNGEFKLHAQTWLNRRGYEDGCLKWRAVERRMAERTQQPKAAPPAASEPVVAQMTQAEREASARRVYERLGLRPPEITH